MALPPVNGDEQIRIALNHQSRGNSDSQAMDNLHMASGIRDREHPMKPERCISVF
jgi:hypothetical protein